MSYGKYKFKDFNEFKTAKDEARKIGVMTASDFSKFLDDNYSHLKIEIISIKS